MFLELLEQIVKNLEGWLGILPALPARLLQRYQTFLVLAPILRSGISCLKSAFLAANGNKANLCFIRPKLVRPACSPSY
jgi:hypothetical protein